ncbi:MAG TPA: 2,3-diaminopropionate biosynthesis protein SbnB [Acidiferrobacterales bacterium]|nr:2,3-diaminopropionate biosynthesis protein SbnB [Acidiferrobacterales bacterium]
MREEDLLVLTTHEVEQLLRGQERALIDLIRSAYVAHATGKTSLPHSVFLRFPNNLKNRIIALPAFLGSDPSIAGIKWISSFPENTNRGLQRASAVAILNSTSTGRAQVIMEASGISAKRTAASAAAAVHALHTAEKVENLGLIGCGVINFNILKFIATIYPDLGDVLVYDIDRARAERFVSECKKIIPHRKVGITDSNDVILRKSSVVSFATTASTPHIGDLSACLPGATILNISLRDLAPEVILSSDNVVDDIDHVCRADTSVHLACKRVGNTDFIRCTLGEILQGKAERRGTKGITVFSPFGLGILDLVVAHFVYERAQAQGKGVVIKSFMHDAWGAGGDKDQGIALS